MKGSDKTDQDFKVGILNEDKSTLPNRDRVEATQTAGTRLARLLLFFYFFFFLFTVMDKGDSFYFNKLLLSFPHAVLFFNPTI